ncbi:hypothetical protein FQR65_LT15100 [Abscondita terminalis]|nr:hypothetical protein FQR65_LT15100 [Abscondita terminalis]
MPVRQTAPAMQPVLNSTSRMPENWWRVNPAYGIKPQIHLKTKSKNKKCGKKCLDFSKRFPTTDITTQEGTVCSVQCIVTEAGFAGVCENVPWPSPSPAPVLPLTIVAILKEYEVQSTKATYELEDHTGRIKAILWLENDNDATPQLPLVKEGCYLRIFGSLRIQDGQKLLMVLRMNSVENPNEITSHLLDVIDVRLQAEALSKGDGLLAKIKKNNPGAELANSMSFMGENMDTSSNNSSLTKMQEKVYNILRGDRSAQGVHRSVVCKEFPVNMHREVDATLEFLIGEGHVYSTIDNDHFKVTDSM